MNSTVYVYCENKTYVADVIAYIETLHYEAHIPHRGLSFDGLSPAVIVTGANVLVAIIGGLFAHIQARHGRTIHIKGAAGFEVTVPADTPPEELDRLIKVATAEKADRIILASTRS